jgi:hypothetical protein
MDLKDRKEGNKLLASGIGNLAWLELNDAEAIIDREEKVGQT